MWAWFALGPLAPADVGLEQAFRALPEAPWGTGIVSGLALGAPLGFLWLGVLWPRPGLVRLGAAAGVVLGLVLLALALQLGQVFYLPRYPVPWGLGGLIAGVVLGVVLWWGAGPALLERLARPRGPWWPVLASAAALTAVLPLDLGAMPTEFRFADTWPGDVPQRVYGLIKAAMPWLPLGFLIALSGRAEMVPRLGMALPVALLLMGWPFLGGMPWQEILELIFALPGLWLGAWLGIGTLAGVGLRAGGAYKAPAPVPPAVTPMADPGGLAAGASRAETAPTPMPEGSRDRPYRRSHTHGRSDRKAERQPDTGLSVVAWRGVGALLLVLALFALLDFSRWPLAIGLGLVVYGGVLWRWPAAWLVTVPAALALLDLAPWTGRFFLDEFDLLMLVTAGVLFLGGARARPRPLPAGAGLWMALFAISALASLLLGLWPPAPVDANAFSSYWSPYNSLRIAKGMVWGGFIFLWVRGSGLEPDVVGRRMALGMGIGLLGVGLVGLWEHWLFAGRDNATYRIFSTFSSMHTGGGHIEAYLAAAVAFLGLGMGRWRDLAITGPLWLLTAVTMLYTVARGGLLALAVVLVILVVAGVRLARPEGIRRAAGPAALMLTVALVLAVGAGGGHWQQRLAQSGQDWQIRMDHWALALGLRDDGAMTGLFGMGLGSFPRAYLQAGPVDKQSGTYAFAGERGNTYLRLGGGDTLYFAQRVAVTGGQEYRLEFDARAEGAATKIETPLCEKQMLNSLRCVWLGFDVPGDGRWHRLSRGFSSAEVGSEPPWRRPPVELFLYMPVKGGVMAVDNFRLTGPDGRDLMCNGDFGRGGDCWFFKTHSHLPWHIKNLWVHVLFEQGWVGLLLFGGLTALALYRLARAGWRGHRVAWAWLASLAGLLTVGMFDSLLDAPRLATLLVALTLLGVGFEWERSARASRTGHSRTRGRQRAREASDSAA